MKAFFCSKLKKLIPTDADNQNECYDCYRKQSETSRPLSRVLCKKQNIQDVTL